jgi:hypothetical protein
MLWFRINSNVFINISCLVRVDRTGADTNKIFLSDGSNFVINDYQLEKIKEALNIVIV